MRKGRIPMLFLPRRVLLADRGSPSRSGTNFRRPFGPILTSHQSETLRLGDPRSAKRTRRADDLRRQRRACRDRMNQIRLPIMNPANLARWVVPLAIATLLANVASAVTPELLNAGRQVSGI